MTTTKNLPESWRPESLLQSRAEALSKETGLSLADAVDHIEANNGMTAEDARRYFDALTARFGMGWHPDDIDDARMDQAFQIFGAAVYAEGITSWRRAGLEVPSEGE